MALNTEVPAVNQTSAVASGLADQVSTLLARGTTTPISSRVKATAADTATLTAAQLLSGYVLGTPTGAANYTLPTAANLVAGLRTIKTPIVGDSFECLIVNTSAGANTITILAGGGTVRGGTQPTIAQNKSARIFINVTNVTAAAEAYDYFVQLTA